MRVCRRGRTVFIRRQNDRSLNDKEIYAAKLNKRDMSKNGEAFQFGHFLVSIAENLERCSLHFRVLIFEMQKDQLEILIVLP